MFVDASAIVAILAREGDAAALAARLGQARIVHTSPMAIFEAVLGLARSRDLRIADAQAAVGSFLQEVGASIEPITEDIGQLAIGAFDRFGKGRHPANLNLGDCFAYACAQKLGVPLLFKGDDFPLTDALV